jgi:hypothetical protein
LFDDNDLKICFVSKFKRSEFDVLLFELTRLNELKKKISLN